MPPFDHTRVSTYSVPQLIEYIKSGEVTFDDLRQLGLHYAVQDQIRIFLAEKDVWDAAIAARTVQAIDGYLSQYPGGNYVDEADRIKRELKEDSVWDWAKRTHTVPAYQAYLRDYPSGKYQIDAEMAINMLEAEERQLKEELFADLREHPWNYTYEDMQQLYNGAELTPAQRDFLASKGSVSSRFLLKGGKITHQELIDANVVPPTVTQLEVCTPEFRMPQTSIEHLGDFPTDRTDVFFLGVPRSGKSSVLAGLMFQLFKDGYAGYVPNFVNGYDPCISYYNGLIKSVATKKPPVPTPTDSISFMKVDLIRGNRKNVLTIVEMAGEAFRKAAMRIGQSEGQQGVWKELGAEKCLRNNNKKVLFFVLDYSAVLGTNAMCTAHDQIAILMSSLTTLCYDGPDPRNPEKGCTMSKVETVAILVTKSDLMKVSSTQGRLAEAQRYMDENFKAFMNQLTIASRKHGCNKANNYMPYFLTFSLGNFYVGNTFVFNPCDSREIIEFIHTVTPTVKIGGWSIF